MLEDYSINKIPPHNADAEREILGAAMFDNTIIPALAESLTAEAFYQTANGIIFQAIIDNGIRDPIDLLTLSEILKRSGALDRVGGAAYLASLLDDVASSANVFFYISMVQNHHLRRQIIKTSGELMNEAYTSTMDAVDLMERAQAQMFAISPQGKDRKYFSTARQVAKETFDIIESRYGSGGGLTGMPSGFDAIDNMTAGFQKGDLIIIAGRPSMGKTALALNVLEHLAVKSGKAGAYFSLEMGETSLMMRLLSSLSGVDGNRLRRGFIRESDWPKLTNAVSVVAGCRLFINDMFDVSPLDVKAKARRLKTEQPDLSCLVVDYIQLMRPSKKETSREREVASISRELKGIAKDLNIPVLALSQLNREVEKQADKRPTMAALRESGAQEQDADVIMMLYRDEVYNKAETNPEKGIAEVIITKQRNGPIGTVKLYFDPTLTRFRNLASPDAVGPYWDK